MSDRNEEVRELLSSADTNRKIDFILRQLVDGQRARHETNNTVANTLEELTHRSLDHEEKLKEHRDKIAMHEGQLAAMRENTTQMKDALVNRITQTEIRVAYIVGGATVLSVVAQFLIK